MTFQLDPFQEQAIKAVQRGHSVFVSAPTGSGKTVIAESVIDRALSQGEHAVYTAPVKALSNQKFRDFKARYGDDKVGILTGDVALNTEAPLLIMTTEIYRNSLLDYHHRIEKIGWVIFDEIHYLDDLERGTVWEEALLFTPARIKILALSATIPNVKELADWIHNSQGRDLSVIEETRRVVPLHFFFQCQGKIQNNLNTLFREGYLNRDNWRMSSRERRRGFRPLRAHPNRLDVMLEHLRKNDRLPLIYFVFGRRRAELLAQEAAAFDFLKPAERQGIVEQYDTLCDRYDLKSEVTALDMKQLIERGIGYHHAGMLPSLKEVIEQLFTSRFLKAIFTTETFALGINMPARSVVFDQLEKFYGTGFRHLSCRDFFQMAGRAGRRGLDPEGFVYSRIQPGDIPFSTLKRILHGQSEPVKSQFNTSYATLLNLYRERGDKLLEIYPRSFHYFQSGERRRKECVDHFHHKLDLLRELGYIDANTVTAKGEFAAAFFGYELVLGEMHEEGLLDPLDESALSVMLCSLIYEPRRGIPPPRLKSYKAQMNAKANEIVNRIHKRETKYHIRPLTKDASFHLAEGVEAWVKGATFDKALSLTAADEGEFVRALRMVIQIVRELRQAPHTSEKLSRTAHTAYQKINRGVVDAERQLRT
ncbi:MAG: DEAD/DEAH box helicase [Candidatus Omnitrophica bacterium]|nr:DEAD/DEAH box helicase [Candidatus Omnitrophota bacterium]